MFLYAIYVYICTVGINCPTNPVRVDNIDSVSHANYLIESLGTRPHYEMLRGDLTYLYSYGECYKGREPTKQDLDILTVAVGGDCNNCVSRVTDTE